MKCLEDGRTRYKMVKGGSRIVLSGIFESGLYEHGSYERRHLQYQMTSKASRNRKLTCLILHVTPLICT